MFNGERAGRREGGLYCEMSSFPEAKAERLMLAVNGDPRNELQTFILQDLAITHCLTNHSQWLGSRSTLLEKHESGSLYEKPGMIIFSIA